MEGGEVTCGILPQSRTENGRAGAYAPVFFGGKEVLRPPQTYFALSNFDNVAFCACRQPLSPPSYVEQNAVTALLLQYHRHTFFQKSIDFLTG